MQRGRALACVVSCAAWLACTGGQSGTETPKPILDAGEPDASMWTTLAAPVSCACTLADRDALLLHVELLAVDSCRVRARVVETLTERADAPLALEPEVEIEAARVIGAGCGDGPDLSAGDDALLVYVPTQPEGENGEASALLATWGSTHVFGDRDGKPIELSEDDREGLLHTVDCGALFDPPALHDAALGDVSESSCSAQ